MATDTVAGAFRDPSIIETCFECVHFSNDIFQTLLAPFITSGIPEERVREFESAMNDALKSEQAVTISDNILGYMEEKWTGHQRIPDETTPASSSRHALMIYYIHISERWQPRRVIACIIFDDDVVRTIQETPSGISRSARGEAGPAEVTTYDVLSLVQCLRSQSTDDILGTAIETRSVFLAKYHHNALGFATEAPPDSKLSAFFQDLQFVASENPRSSIDPVTRSSSIVEYQRISSTNSTSAFIAPYKSKPLFTARRGRMKSVLVYSIGIRAMMKHGGLE
jgi:hypothetical protein